MRKTKRKSLYKTYIVGISFVIFYFIFHNWDKIEKLIGKIF
jgi:hypothetical protein